MADTVQSRPFSVLQFMTHWLGGWFWPPMLWAEADDARRTRPRAATTDRFIISPFVSAAPYQVACHPPRAIICWARVTAREVVSALKWCDLPQEATELRETRMRDTVAL